MREHRRRIGLAGSAVEASFRDDLPPTDLIMTARHAATEPWWHDYTDEDRARARDLAIRFGLAATSWTTRSGHCRPASGDGPPSPGR